MPTGYLNLVDLAKRSNNDAMIGLVDDVIFNSPEIEFLPALTKTGTSYRVGKVIGYPTAQFAQVSGGVTPSKSKFDQKVASLNLVNLQLQVPEEVVLADEGNSLEDILSGEATRTMRAAFQLLGTQMYYGTTADANGFQGLQTTISGVAGFDIDASNGSPNTAGGNSSVYLVRMEDDGVSLAVGRQGAMNLTPWSKQQIVISGSTPTTQKVTMGYVSSFMGFFGLTVASEYSVWRIRNISSVIGKPSGGTTFNLTDALGAQLLAQVPRQFRRNLRWFMTRDAAFSLEASRTAVTQQATTPEGGYAWSGEPTKLAGFPITVTDSLKNPALGAGGE